MKEGNKLSKEFGVTKAFKGGHCIAPTLLKFILTRARQ
jgi:hypothetical protein